MNPAGLVIIAVGIALIFYSRSEFTRRIATRWSRRMLGEPWGDVFAVVTRYAFVAMCGLFIVVGVLAFAGAF
jgi:hypothetical protein